MTKPRINLSKPPSLTARIIELHRVEPKLTQKAIARRLGCTPMSVSVTLRAAQALRELEEAGKADVS